MKVLSVYHDDEGRKNFCNVSPVNLESEFPSSITGPSSAILNGSGILSKNVIVRDRPLFSTSRAVVFSTSGHTTKTMDNLLSLIQSNPNGISSEELCQRANLPATQVLQALNHFLGRHAIVAIRDGSGKTLFRAQEDAELGNKLRGLKADERKIYDVIIESKDQGLATKDLQRKTNLPAAHVKTVCTRLAGRGRRGIW